MPQAPTTILSPQSFLYCQPAFEFTSNCPMQISIFRFIHWWTALGAHTVVAYTCYSTWSAIATSAQIVLCVYVYRCLCLCLCTCSKRSLFTFSHVYNKLIPSYLNGISKRADQTLIQISSSHAAPFRPHHVIIWFISQTPPITMKDTSHMVFHHTRHCCPLVIIIIRNNQLHTLNTNDHVSTNQIYLLEHLHTEHQSQGCIFKYDYQSACI